MRGHPSSLPPGPVRTGLVLSGGGTRGAYEAGVLLGMIESLGSSFKTISPFDVVAGTSVGAINAAFVAANAHQPGLAIEKLVEAWVGMDFSTVFSPQLLQFVRQLARGTSAPKAGTRRLGASLLNPVPLEELVRSTVSFDAIHSNIKRTAIHGLFIAALHVATGKTKLFYEASDQVHYLPSKDPRRVASREPITLEHVLASTAIPLLFPARRVGEDFYCDGGLRFNTPVAPVIRAGARRVVIVSTTYVEPERWQAPPEALSSYPSLASLTGKVLNALLLDPLTYDLQILARINDLVDVHSRGLQQQHGAELDRAMIRRRGATYRHIDTLVFAPTKNIAKLASAYLRDNLSRLDIGLVARRLLRTASEETNADWATYLLFDGGFAEQVIELGRRDAVQRRDEIRAFLGA